MKVLKFQQGGVAPEGAAPEQGGAPAGAGAEEQLAQMAQKIVQQLGPEASAALAQMIMQLIQGGAQPQGQPTYQRKGGRLVPIGKR